MSELSGLLRSRSALPIYIDVDDVLSETGQALCRCVQNEFGKTVPFEEVRDFDLTVSFGLDPEEFRHLFALFHRDEVLMSLAPLSHARETVRLWFESGREIHVVTGRPWRTRGITTEWLRFHEIPFHQLHIVDKYGRESAESALSLKQLAERPYAFAVEDSVRMIEFISREMKTPVFLIRRPWNEMVAAGELVAPVCGWQELRQLCGSLFIDPVS